MRLQQRAPTSFTRPPRPSRRRLALAVLGFVVLVAAFVVPIPIFYMFVPGPVRDVQRLVRVSDARTYSSEGRLYMTTVSVDIRVTAAEIIAAAVDPDRQVVWSQDVTGGAPLREVENRERALMADSKRHAEEVALAALGLAEPTGAGARVVAVQDGTPAEGEFEPGDVIVEVDGSRVDTTCDVGQAIDGTDIGESITFTVRRAGGRETVTVETAPNPNDPTASYVGIAMRDEGYRFEPGVDVEFETGRIAGPSAGLMFTLALYDRLTEDDLTDGRLVAGTGEIDCGGGIGPIGGIVQKVAAAERAGAQVFLAPALNAEDARSAADGIRVVAVSDFQDALDYLEGRSS